MLVATLCVATSSFFCPAPAEEIPERKKANFAG
jgi:hypothetical protein